jgi:hypothetical protein
MNLADAITPNTSVTLTVSAFIGMAVTVALGVWRISALLHQLEQRFDRLERRQTETWSLSDMRAWARLIDRANKDLSVPDPDLVISDSSYRKEGTRAPHDHS